MKASGADIRTKVKVIRSNAHKYSISALCKCLGIARSTCYYEVQQPTDESSLETEISKVFYENRQAYGSRKIQNIQNRICLREKLFKPKFPKAGAR